MRTISHLHLLEYDCLVKSRGFPPLFAHIAWIVGILPLYFFCNKCLFLFREPEKYIFCHRLSHTFKTSLHSWWLLYFAYSVIVTSLYLCFIFCFSPLANRYILLWEILLDSLFKAIYFLVEDECLPCNSCAQVIYELHMLMRLWKPCDHHKVT